MVPAKPHALERLRRAEKGEVALFWSRYGGAGEGFILKAVCADGGRLSEWVREIDLPEGRIFRPGMAMPSITLTRKAAREVLGRVLAKNGGLQQGATIS